MVKSLTADVILRVQIPDLRLPSCVPVGMLLHLSVPVFPSVVGEIKGPTSWGCCENTKCDLHEAHGTTPGP